jgi:hypothetical protein
MIRSRRIRIVAAVGAAVAVVALSAIALLPRYLDLETYKQNILDAARQSLDRQVLYRSGSFSFRFGPNFTFTDVVVKEKDGKSDFIRAASVTFRVGLLPLLQKKLYLRHVVVEKPEGVIVRDRSGKLNIGDLLEKKKEAVPLRVTGLRVKEGKFRFVDRFVAANALVTTLTETDLSINRVEAGEKSNIKLSAKVAGTEGEGTVATTGEIRLPKSGEPLSRALLDLTLKVKNLPVGHYWPYYSSFVPFEKITGNLTTETSFTGELSRFSSKGNVRFSKLRFSYPQVFHAVLTPGDLRFAYQMELGKGTVAVKKLDLSMDGLDVRGNCTISEIPGGDPRITARAVTSRFRLEEFRNYIPYGIISHDTSIFIEQHVIGGTYRLLEGTLDGKASQIAHMEKGTNYNVLYIKGTAEKGVLTFGEKVPQFKDVAGELELSGKNFNLNRMSGKFGGSPFTLEGKIRDYPLDTASEYPFTATFSPQPSEVGWLSRMWGTAAPAYSGKSSLKLAGSGPTSAYLLSGSWDLTPAAYSTAEIRKPANVGNALTFRTTLSPAAVRIHDLQYVLARASVNVSGKVDTGKKQHSSLDLKTNTSEIGEIVPFLPGIATYQPRGKVQLTLHTEGPLKDFRSMEIGGSGSFTEASLRLSESFPPVGNLSGSARFTGTGFETSLLTGQVGSSTIYGKLAVQDFKSPAVTLAFSSQSLNPADFGLRNPERKDLRVTKLQGNVVMKNDGLQIRSLTGQVNRSALAVKGMIQNPRSPRADLVVNASYLDVDDILLLASLERPRKTDFVSPPFIKASVHADAGRMRQVPFEKLAASAVIENRILYLQPVGFSSFGGNVTGTGRFDLGPAPSPPYHVTCGIEGASAEKFLQALGVTKQEVTGTLSLEADISGRGATEAEIKKTALGSAKVRFEEGTIRRFATLSKVFSILNVSQLLKFHLPDMVSGGMPYDEITGNLSFRDGTVTTSDLFVKSEAMNISVVGKADIVKEELDLTIGVQPLQTVDKIVNRIPIVGWILTGKDRSLITSYFEAKGPWHDPKVSAVPVKALGKGVFNIFKRVFQLPAKLFTDTGEVITGK